MKTDETANTPDADTIVAIKMLDSILGVAARKPGAAAKLPAVIRTVEALEPAGGKQFPVFPASYAGEQDSDGATYDLNGIEYGPRLREIEDKKGKTRFIQQIINARHCTMDSPQSHANRTEEAFVEDEELKSLVPQAVATIPREPGKKAEESVLRLPHRVADFRVRVSNRRGDVEMAIKEFADGDALKLLRLMPTSIVFGFWDSRAVGNQYKHARILLSRIDAFDVVPCQKHSLYSGPYSKDEFASVVLGDEKLAAKLEGEDQSEEEKVAADKAAKAAGKKMAARGFTSAPSSGLGGVIVNGKIERLSLVSLTDIARIFCCEENSKGESAPPKKTSAKPSTDAPPANPSGTDLTNAARRYVLALALLAEGFPRSTGSYRLRSGCELISLNSKPAVDLRGGDSKSPDSQALIDLCDNRELLIKIATQAQALLGVQSTQANFEVTKEALKTDLTAGKKKQKDAAGPKKRGEKNTKGAGASKFSTSPDETTLPGSSQEANDK